MPQHNRQLYQSGQIKIVCYLLFVFSWFISIAMLSTCSRGNTSITTTTSTFDTPNNSTASTRIVQPRTEYIQTKSITANIDVMLPTQLPTATFAPVHVLTRTETLTEISEISPTVSVSISTDPLALLLPRPTITSTGTEHITTSWEITSVTPPVLYLVEAGDTLSGIAAKYNITVEALMLANQLENDRINSRQILFIPPTSDPQYTFEKSIREQIDTSVTISETHLISAAYRDVQPISYFSVLEGDLDTSYPIALDNERFTLHYATASDVGVAPTELVEITRQALIHHEQLLHTKLIGRFDLYIANTIFASPNQALRGRSFSSQRRVFILNDGTGGMTDTQYILAHELTHTFTWNTFGAPSSVMLHEGVAVYAGMEFIANSDYMPLAQFCSIYYQAGALPLPSSELTFQGHIRDLENYYTAGCFVQYLIEQYGADQLGKLYHSGDYFSIYGKTLRELEIEWRGQVAATVQPPVGFTPLEFTTLVSTVKQAFSTLFANFQGSSKQMEVYFMLDKARVALLKGDIEQAKGCLDLVQSIITTQ